MDNHGCEVVLVTCIDYRLQEAINKWIAEKFAPKTFDRVAIAGGVFDLEYVLKQVEISKRLHHIKKVVLLNHEDCGAYGEEETHEKHIMDLEEAKKRVEESFAELDIETYYLHLDGTFEKVSS